MNKRIFTFIGPSGSGKTTLAKELLKYKFVELVSFTTRNPRIGEVEGYDYYFKTLEQLDNIEIVEIVNYAGNYYGLFKEEIDSKLSEYDNIFVIVDKQGVEKLKEIYGSIIKVIYIYCSLNTLYQRMLNRGNTMTEVQKRIDYLCQTQELDNIYLADYVIITDKCNIEESKKLLKNIVDINQINKKG